MVLGSVIRYKAVLWSWLTPTSAAAAIGRPMAGGQAHITFGRCGDDIRCFFQQSGVQETRRQWSFITESYGDIPAWNLRITENSPQHKRALECRLPSQTPRSRNYYPLWQRRVISIPAGSRSRQLVAVLRDTEDRFHVRIIDADALDRFPDKVVQAMLSSRHTSRQQVYVGSGEFRDLPPSLPSGDRAATDEQGFTGSVPGPDDTMPLPNGAPSWEQLAAYVREIEGRAGRRHVAKVDHRLRDYRVRKLALSCFGHRCQVRGCAFTSGAPQEWLPYLVEVHHLLAVARGGSDSLLNLVVICANHHKLCERLPGVRVIESHDTDDCIIEYDGGSFLIERDLSSLRATL